MVKAPQQHIGDRWCVWCGCPFFVTVKRSENEHTYTVKIDHTSKCELLLRAFNGGEIPPLYDYSRELAHAEQEKPHD